MTNSIPPSVRVSSLSKGFIGFPHISHELLNGEFDRPEASNIWHEITIGRVMRYLKGKEELV